MSRRTRQNSPTYATDAAVTFVRRSAPFGKILPTRLRLPLAASTIPAVVTYGADGTTTITGSTLTSYTDSRFVYTGADFQPYIPNNAYGFAKQIGVTQTVGGLAVNFGFQGQVFEWRTSVSAGMYRIWVNGQPLTTAFQSYTGTLNSDRLIKVDMGSRDVWDVRIEMDRSYFGGIRTIATDLIFPPLRTSPLRALVVGDSFGNGQSFSGGGALTGAPIYTPGYYYSLAEMLGIDDLWPRSIGGTGYLATNTGTQPTYRSRLTNDVIPYSPDVLIFQGTINDSGLDVTAEINALYAAVKAALPSTYIIATSPLVAGAQTAAIDTLTALEQAAWQALGVPFIDLHTMNTGTGNTGWKTVTDAATTSGSVTITSATIGFAAGDVGKVITGAGIPANSIIQGYTNATTASLSIAATATATGATVTLTNQKKDGSADYNKCPDGTHPSYPAGFRHIAQRLATSLNPLLKSAV